jgi:DNA-binding ferritin-like protein
VLKDVERADEIAAETPEAYAERKRVTIKNPSLKEQSMSSLKQLKETVKEQATMIEELEEELEALRTAVSSAAELLPDDEEEEEDDEAEDNEEES